MKIKVKRVRGGSMGDQRDYGLVAGSIWNYEDKPTTNQVSDTVGPVDRDEATIEAERGETVVGDINNDGMLEHFIVGGKRHFQGGTPLNVPDGSFVFSDTRALNIKNKDVLKNIFGVTASKGMTPAKVAKKFDLNQYNDLLLDPEADAMSKRTAQMMLDNNLKKLGQLALVQEGMKGFPDGIPDIALPLFASDIASSQPSQQMMRRGGLVKYQNAGNAKRSFVQNATLSDATTRKVEKDAFKKALDLYWHSDRDSPEENKAMKMFFNLGQIPNLYTLYDLGLEGEHGEYLMPYYPFEVNPNLKYDSNTGEELDPHDQGNYLLGAMRGDPYLNPQMVNAVLNKGQSPGITRTTPVKPRKGLSALPPKFELTTPDEGSVQRPVVEKANQIFKSAFNSDDENAILSAISQIQGLDVPFSWSTPATTIGVGFGKINPLPGGTPFRTGNRLPEGLTWQEKVNDMADILEDRLRTIRSNKELEKKRKESAKQVNQARAKNQQLVSKANEILANPSQATADQINTATNILKINSIRSGAARVTPYFSDASSLLQYGQSDLDKAYQTLFGEAQAAEEQVTAEQEAYNAATDTTDFAATDTTIVVDPATGIVGQQPASQQSASQQASTQSAPVRAPKSSQPSDDQIFNRLKAVKEGEDPTPEEIAAYKRTMGYKKMGGDLSVYQTGEEFNLTDKKFKDAAKQKGLQVTPSVWDWYDPYLPSIGAQGVLSPSGIYSTATGPKPNIDKLKNYPGVTDWNEYDPGGFDKWKADMAKAKGNASKASEFWAKKRKEYEIANAGMSSIDENVQGWNIPGVELMTPYVFTTTLTPTAGQDEPPPDAPAPAIAAAKKFTDPPTPVYSPTSYYQPWSNYSNVDVAAAMTNYFGVKRGDLPTLYNYAPNIPDPTFLDKSRPIAQQQGLVAQSTEDIASRSMDPTTARANTIAAQAQSADPIANIQSNVDQANVQIANQFALQNANTLNEAQLRNIAFRDKYQTELQTLEQQYQNARREGRTEVAEAIKRAMVDQMQRGALNVQNPNYAIGPNGQIYFKPGYDIRTGKNIYADNSLPGESLLTRVMEQYDLNAKDAADVIKTLSGNKKRSVSKYGMTVSNPMDIIWG